MTIDFDVELAKEAVLCGLGKIVTRNGYIVDIIDWEYSGQVPEYTIGGFINGIRFQWTNRGKRSLLSKEDPYDLLYIIVEEGEEEK